jgi:hypothetical protein
LDYIDGVRGKTKAWLLPLIFVVVFALSRWPGLMPPNFSAAYAFAFCAGVYFHGRLRWVLPLGTILAMDVLLNIYYDYTVPVPNHPHAYLLDPGMWLFIGGKLLAFAGLVWLGSCFSRKNSFLSLLGGGILGAVLFYLLTNFASWLYDPAYQKSLKGLFQALTSGVPGFPPTWTFFRNTLLSGGLFTGLFAGSMKLSEAAEPAEDEQEEETPPETEPEKAPA